MLFNFKGLWDFDSICDIEKRGRNIVIASEILENPGTSITNFAGELATIVCKQYGINPTELIWIERYPADNTYNERFALVTFSIIKHPNGYDYILRNPSWKALGRGIVDHFIASHMKL